MGAAEVQAFLTYLAVKEHVAASTQNQAFSALLFRYKEVLHQDLGPVDALRTNEPPTPARRPDQSRGSSSPPASVRPPLLMSRLLYGSGLRLMECVRLRVQDLDFDYLTITVRDGKGEKDRVTILPQSLVALLKDHLRLVKHIHEEDPARGYGAVYLPDALACKDPNAEREWIWQYVFPADRLSVDPRSGVVRRHYIHENTLQKAIRAAAQAAGIPKRVSPHTLATPSPLISWRRITTSALCRNSSGIRT
ncbi:MAG: hypothetical protein KatS3mg058_0190 [Roseiflexus sp.]|nr:MAG: hypothetical protein KatS3mg051_2345 [Anaerolineae bacterium]GIV98786.1 MAG: hypothetical protein KatS3mg058_0190 [Roseiflexus sp.]